MIARRVVDEIMQRAHDEPTFHELLLKCPAGALGACSLAGAERAALMRADTAQLEALGVAPAVARQWSALDGLS